MTFVTVLRRGRLHDAIDGALAERGLRRRVIASLPPTQVVLTWHHRHDSDPAHAWLRGQVRDVLREATDGTA
ncbi:hypothetical protein [Streptomyces sp. Inha503]|uniref:hypothetical protein n=1 Tax=Streptomyces sp. Inha503 TaxID=3383314 RepID=UPI00399FE965